MRTTLDDRQGDSNYESSQPSDIQDQPRHGGPPSEAAVDAAERLSAKMESVSSKGVSWTSAHSPVYLTSNPVSISPARPHVYPGSVLGVSDRGAATRVESGSACTLVSSSNRRGDDPAVSPFSVPGVPGSVAATRADQFGSACTIVSSSSRRGYASALLPSHGVSNVSGRRYDDGVSSVYGRGNCPDAASVRQSVPSAQTRSHADAHLRPEERATVAAAQRPQHSGASVSVGPPAHRQFTPGGPGKAAPPVVPLFPTSASIVAATRDDLPGNTHNDDQSARSSVTHSSVAAARRSALPPVSPHDRVSARGSSSSAYNTRVPAHRHPDLSYPVEEVSHGHATRLLSCSASPNTGNDVARRIATRASIELNGLCPSPIRFIKEGTSQHFDRAQHPVHMHNRSTGKGSTMVTQMQAMSPAPDPLMTPSQQAQWINSATLQQVEAAVKRARVSRTRQEEVTRLQFRVLDEAVRSALRVGLCITGARHMVGTAPLSHHERILARHLDGVPDMET